LEFSIFKDNDNISLHYHFPMIHLIILFLAMQPLRTQMLSVFFFFFQKWEMVRSKFIILRNAFYVNYVDAKSVLLLPVLLL